MSLLSVILRTATATVALALSATAIADDDVDDVELELYCSYTCAGGGFDIHVYQHPTLTQYSMRLDPTWEVTYSDWQGASNNATYLGSQNVAGSDYNDLYCEPDGLYINGDVYENYESSTWNSHTTGLLNGENPCAAGGTINHALDLIDMYTTSPWQEVPEFCEDVGCAGPPSGIVDHTDPMDNYNWYNGDAPCQFWIPEMGCLDDQSANEGEGQQDPCDDPNILEMEDCESALTEEVTAPAERTPPRRTPTVRSRAR